MPATEVDPTGIVPDAYEETVRDAYESVKAIRRPGVTYTITWDDADGQILKRFGRKLPVEAWLIAVPVDDEGKRQSGVPLIMCAVALDARTVVGLRDSVQDRLRAELAALLAEDAA